MNAADRVMSGLLICLVAVSGCSTRGKEPGRAAANSDESIQKPSTETSSQAAPPLHMLLDSLRRLPATFAKDKTYNLWEFHGDRSIFDAIAHHGDSATRALVDLLDDTTASLASAEGKPVPAGVMFYQALKRVAYYEWDCTADYRQLLCEGFPYPDATNTELRNAKLAWREALARRIVIRKK